MALGGSQVLNVVLRMDLMETKRIPSELAKFQIDFHICLRILNLQRRAKLNQIFLFSNSIAFV